MRSVARAFADRSWPLQTFFLAFRSRDELSRALDELDETYGGRRFIREAKERVRTGEIAVSEEQLAVM